MNIERTPTFGRATWAHYDGRAIMLCEQFEPEAGSKGRRARHIVPTAADAWALYLLVGGQLLRTSCAAGAVTVAAPLGREFAHPTSLAALPGDRLLAAKASGVYELGADGSVQHWGPRIGRDPVVAADPSGRVWVLATGASYAEELRLFDPSGAQLHLAANPAFRATGGTPHFVGVDGHGRLHVADQARSRICRVDADFRPEAGFSIAPGARRVAFGPEGEIVVGYDDHSDVFV